MKALFRSIKVARGDEAVTLHEPSDEGDSQSNHYAEGAVNTIKGLMRTLLSTTEANLGIKIRPNHALVPWMLEEAVSSRNRFQLGADGRTGIQRLRMRPRSKPAHEFAEKVMFTPVRGKTGKKCSYDDTRRSGIQAST